MLLRETARNRGKFRPIACGITGDPSFPIPYEEREEEDKRRGRLGRENKRKKERTREEEEDKGERIKGEKKGGGRRPRPKKKEEEEPRNLFLSGKKPVFSLLFFRNPKILKIKKRSR